MGEFGVYIYIYIYIYRYGNGSSRDTLGCTKVGEEGEWVVVSGGKREGGRVAGATITEMRPITPSLQRHRVSGARTRTEGIEGVRRVKGQGLRSEESGQSSLGFPLERRRRGAGLA